MSDDYTNSHLVAVYNLSEKYKKIATPFFKTLFRDALKETERFISPTELLPELKYYVAYVIAKDVYKALNMSEFTEASHLVFSCEGGAALMESNKPGYRSAQRKFRQIRNRSLKAK